MSLASLRENQAVANQLLASLKTGRNVHAYLFIGGENRRQLGMQLSKALLCEAPEDGDACGICPACRKFDSGNSEDFIFMDMETAPGNAKTQMGTAVVEHIQERLKYKSYGRRSCVLVDDAHMLNSAAQNKLLKTLEEPAAESVIILLAESADALLPTVRSRCSTYYLQGNEKAFDPAVISAAKQMFRLIAEGSPFYEKKDCLKPLLERENPRETGLSFAACLEDLLREALLCPYKPSESVLTAGFADFGQLCEQAGENAIFRGISACEEAAVSLRFGYNPGYTLKKLCLKI